MPASIWQRLGDVPRGNRMREARVADYLSPYCTPVRQPVIRGYSNVICHFEGERNERFVVGAHHDRIGGGTGTADNWTGIVLLAALAEHLARETPQFSWTLVAFAEEEWGLKGSIRYVDHLEAPVRAMINIGTIGTDTVAIDRRSDDQLACLAQSVATALGVEYRDTLLRETVSDWEPFQKADIPVLSLNSLSRMQIHKLHTRRDRLTLLREARMDDAWQVLVNLQQQLDQPGKSRRSFLPRRQSPSHLRREAARP